LQHIYNASHKVDIITPNHEELADMQGLKFSDVLTQHNNNFKQAVEYCGRKLLEGGLTTCKALVVRASKYGAMVISYSNPTAIHWVPAYWNWKKDGEHVIDVTGAGNAFCGGFSVGWIETHGDPVESARYGAVSASYAVEQLGAPVFSFGSDGKEQWNQGPSPKERLDALKKSNCIFE
jgi:sugar/nucleoside kinase (ribokinase family)